VGSTQPQTLNSFSSTLSVCSQVQACLAAQSRAPPPSPAHRSSTPAANPAVAPPVSLPSPPRMAERAREAVMDDDDQESEALVDLDDGLGLSADLFGEECVMMMMMMMMMMRRRRRRRRRRRMM
jgi:hypothetical protein